MGIWNIRVDDAVEVTPVEQLTFTPNAMYFHYIAVGETSDAQQLTITNTGNQPVSIAAVDVTGDFELDSSALPVTLDEGESISFDVTFVPTELGTAIGEVQIETGTEDPHTILALIGVGGVYDATLRAELASPTGAELITFNDGGVGAVDVTLDEILRAGPLYPDMYGVKLANTAAVNGVAMQKLVNRASLTGQAIVFREKMVPLDRDILVPVGANPVSIYGLTQACGVKFFGATVVKGFHFNNGTPDATPDYDRCGTIANMSIYGDLLAKRAVTFENNNHPTMRDCYIEGFDGTAVLFYDTLMGLFESTTIVGCGNATEEAVRVTGTDAIAYGSTTWKWDHSRISGGRLTGALSAGVKGGLAIDRCAAGEVDGGGIESSGTPIRIGCDVSSYKPVSDFTVGGEIDLENPGDANCYIDIGSGWVPGTQGVLGIQLKAITGSPSATLNVIHGVRAAKTIGFVAHEGVRLPLNDGTGGTTAGVSDFEFTSNLNIGPIVRANRRGYGSAWPWVRENTTQRVDASPRADWFSDEVNTLNQQYPFPASTAIASIQYAAGGGIYRRIVFINSGAQFITNFQMAGGAAPPNGAVIHVFGDGYSIIQHAQGGNGQICTTAAANLTLSNLQCATFIAHSGVWKQVRGT